MTMPTLRTGDGKQLVELPDQWQRKKLKYMSSRPIRNGLGEAANSDDPEHPRYIRITDIAGPRQLRSDTFRSLLPAIASEAPVHEHDILISAVGATYGKSFFAQDLPSQSCFAGYLVRLSPVSDIDPSFLAYWTESQDYWAQVDANVIQATIQNFSAAKVRRLCAPVPPFDTQRRIARFLDEKTARIDGLIEKKRTLLDRLAEKRQALITRAVTKGLNPAAPMKPSGIDWIGEIPAHWDIRRIKELGALIGGSGFPHDFQGQQDLELPFFKVIDLGRVRQSQKMLNAENTVDRITAKLLGASIIEPGDVVFAKVGAALLLNRFRSIGIPCCIDNNMMAFRPGRQISPDFARLAFSRVNFSDIVNPGAVPSVSGSQIGQLEIALPRLNEQIEIEDSLRQECNDIEFGERQIANSQRLMEEYRGALITAAVTGQITGL